MKTFHLPDLGEGLAEAEIREWYVKEGDLVKVDQPLVSMETAKAVVDVPSPYNGKIIQLHGKPNDIIPTGSPLISFEAQDNVETKENVEQKPKGSVVGSLEESSKKWDEGEVIIGASKAKSQSVKAMPAARVLAKEMHVDLAQVKASGPQGLITAEDVKQYLSNKQQPSTSSIALKGHKEGLHGVRRVMAQVMSESHREIAPSTIIEDADITNLTNKDLTVELLKAMAAASEVEPSLNAWFDGKALERQLFKEVHVGLAVDTPEGLFVPVIKNVEKQTDKELRSVIENFKNSVRTRTIASSDMQGATIVLSNFGSIAGRYATPIIVPPTVAILGCGRYRDAAIVRKGQITAGRILPLSLTFDHRAVTGGEATRYLGAVIQYLQLGQIK